MFKKIVLLAVTIIITLTLTFFAFAYGLLFYMDWSRDMYWASLEKTPNSDYLSEWESDTIPKMTLNVAGNCYCTISEKVYHVTFAEKNDQKYIRFYEAPNGWYEIVLPDDEIVYISEAGPKADLFTLTDYDYQETENGTKFIVYISPRADDIFQGKVSEITFTKK